MIRRGFGFTLHLATLYLALEKPRYADPVPLLWSFLAINAPPATSWGQKQGFLGSNAIHTCMMWFCPGRAAAPRAGLGLYDLTDYVAQSHTLQVHCVTFGQVVTGRTRNTHYRAARYALPGRDLHPLDRASFAWRTVW